MRKVMEGFLILAGLFLIGAGYFTLQLFTGEQNIGEIIALPIFIGFALISTTVSLLIALVLYVLSKKRKRIRG